MPTDGRPAYPKREDIEDAIRHVEIRTDDLEPASGIVFAVADLRALAQAARWALELVDFDNPPLTPEELAQLRLRPAHGLGSMKMMRGAKLKKGRAKR